MNEGPFDNTAGSTEAGECLSDGLTGVWKWGLPVILMAVFAINGVILFRSGAWRNMPLSTSIVLAVVVVGGLGLTLALCGALKQVTLAGDKLLVSNGLSSCEVRLENLVGVRQMTGVHIGSKNPVVLELSEPSPMGKKITFLPAGRGNSSPFMRRPDPIVARLQAIAAANRNEAEGL